MTELDLTPIKQRLDAATDGPWKWGNIYNLSARQGVVDVLELDMDYDSTPEDRTFIAAAPTDIAALIAEVERLRAEVESLESTLMEDY